MTIALEVVRGHTVSVRLAADQGIAATEVPPAIDLVHTRSHTTGRIESHELRGGDDNHQFTLAPGEYGVFAVAGVSNGDETSWVARCNIRITPDSKVVTIPCQVGETRRGRILTASGQPAANRNFHWTLPEWRGENSTRWLYSARTDATGRFELRGTPAGVTLHSTHATMQTRFDSGANNSLHTGVAGRRPTGEYNRRVQPKSSTEEFSRSLRQSPRQHHRLGRRWNLQLASTARGARCLR